jgi:CheY-like chemotaxis protein
MNPSPSVLLVEDSDADARLLMSLFQMEGYQGGLHWVKNGEDALDFLFRRAAFNDAPRPDLVLLDLNLPRVNGREVLRAIRASDQLTSIPVIVMTTSCSDSDIVGVFELRAKGFLTKPKDLDEYEALAKRIISIDLPLAIGC